MIVLTTSNSICQRVSLQVRIIPLFQKLAEINFSIGNSLNALEKPKRRVGTSVQLSELEMPQFKSGNSPSAFSTTDESVCGIYLLLGIFSLTCINLKYATPRKPTLAITFRTSVERTVDDNDNDIQSVPQAV